MRLRLNITARIVVVLIFFCAVWGALARAQAIGGPMSQKEVYCFTRNHLGWEGSWSKFFTRTSGGTERLQVLEMFSLKGTGVYRQLDYTFRAFRLTLDASEVDLFPLIADDGKPLVDWRCVGYIPQSSI